MFQNSKGVALDQVVLTLCDVKSLQYIKSLFRLYLPLNF